MEARKRKPSLLTVLVTVLLFLVAAPFVLPPLLLRQPPRRTPDMDCLSHVKQLATGVKIYLADHDDRYPDILQDGSPSFLTLMLPYTKSEALTRCPSDSDREAKACSLKYPKDVKVTSYIANGSLLGGAHNLSIERPDQLVLLAERRVQGESASDQFCGTYYRPWFGQEMDAQKGAIGTTKHDGKASYAFSDSHVKRLVYSETYDPPRKDLHSLARR